VSDIDIAVADSLKVLDLKRPIREADIEVLKARGPLVLSGCGGRSHSKHRQLLPYASKLR
jgi:hypothetical protein